MRKLLYILNPISGTNNKQSLKDIIAAETTNAKIDFEIFPSVVDGDYSFLDDIIKEKKFTDIIIAGGDGTVNQVIKGLSKHKLPFGIIPCGSGNGLALSAGISRVPATALKVVFDGKSEWVDAFLINDQFGCMLCGLGFDAHVAHEFAKGTKRGLMSYVKKAVSHFFVSVTYPFILETKKNKLELEAYFISIANSNQFGNNFTIAPRASLTDGLLDIVIMTRQNKLNVLLQTIRQVSGFNQLQKIGKVTEDTSVVYFQTKDIRISNPHLAPLHIDGEPVDSPEQIMVTVLPKYFQLIFP